MVLLNKDYMKNPFVASPTPTQEQFNQRMTESFTRPKDPNTMYLSPKFEDSTQTIMTDYGPREVTGKQLTGVTQSGAEIAANEKVSRAKQDALKKSGEPVPKGKPLLDLPDVKDTKLTFGQKLSAGLDKVFNMQENNPEAYRKVMSGFDIYLRGQRGDDLITAITGNSKFNAEQASALLQSSLAANNLKLSQMKVLKAEKEAVEVDAPSDDLKKLAGNILDKDFDIDNENIAFQIASRAKVKQRNTPGLDEATALDLAIQDAVASGELTSGKGKLGSGKFKSNVGQAIEIGDDEQDKLDALPTGTKFTYKGKTYVK